MRKFSFQLKLSLIFIILLVIILLTTTFFIYQRAISQQKEQLRGRILSLAKFASIFIDGDKHSRIDFKNWRISTEYKEIKAVLEKIRNVDPLIDSAYTMVKTEKKNIWRFVVDSGDKKGVFAYCGEYYNISHLPEMQLAFFMPSVDKKLNRDKWGMWLSGYAPVYDSSGQAVAIVGLDVSAKSIRYMQVILAKKFLIVLIFGVIISLFMGWVVAIGITRPLNNLTRGVKEVEKGNFENRVDINTKDEIEELAVAFNKMTKGLKEMQDRLQRNYLNTIQSLSHALEAKDPYIRGHSERVKRYAVAIAGRLGLSEGDIRLLEDICILHDIGKIGVPESILTKSEPLSEKEWQIIKMHPIIGEEILKHIEFLKPGLSIIRDHHERPDGKGYPHNLKVEEISLLASIIAVADAFDAMTSDRPYRKAFAQDKAVAVLRDNIGTQFNSLVVETFIDCLTENI